MVLIGQIISIASHAKADDLLARFNSEAIQDETKICPAPILESLEIHKIEPGETIESIALNYNLLPETLVRINDNLQQGLPPAGTEIKIPPFNGVILQVPEGANWKDLETAYGVRADVLFEINGCQKTPQTVFIPGVNWTPASGEVDNYTGLTNYPLPKQAKVGLAYGWQVKPNNGSTIFHSGIDLLAETGTPVSAAETGIVVFTGREVGYGNLTIINHQGGRQTRYAHLDNIQVRLNQQINAGDVVGTVGTTGTPDIDTPHLHFEIRYSMSVGWIAQDPIPHLK